MCRGESAINDSLYLIIFFEYIYTDLYFIRIREKEAWVWQKENIHLVFYYAISYY